MNTQAVLFSQAVLTLLNLNAGSKATWKGSWFFPAKSLPEAGPELEATRPQGSCVPLKDVSVPQAFQD